MLWVDDYQKDVVVIGSNVGMLWVDNLMSEADEKLSRGLRLCLPPGWCCSVTESSEGGAFYSRGFRLISIPTLGLFYI